jgi:hypothetical protein
MTKKATAGKKAKTPKAEKAAKTRSESSGEAKASEVIASVPIALLEARPTLPSGDTWLGLFSDHYQNSAARAALRAEALEVAPTPEPEPEPAKRAGKKGRSPFIPPTLPSARPVVVAHEPLPDLSFTAPSAEPIFAVEPEPIPEPTAELEADPNPESAAPAEPEPEFDLFAQLAAEEERSGDPDDFLARLQAQGEAAVDGRPLMFEEEDFAKRLPSDHSSPFIPAPTDLDGQTTMIAALPDEDEGTAMIAAVSDEAYEDEAPRLAEPGDSTTMIAAISDDELDSLTAPGEEGEAPKAGRKSRKASKKKKG